MININEELVERVAIEMHYLHADDSDPKWGKQPGKYRAQMRRDARDALTALSNLGLTVEKRAKATGSVLDAGNAA